MPTWPGRVSIGTQFMCKDDWRCWAGATNKRLITNNTWLNAETVMSNYLIFARVRFVLWVQGRLGYMGMNINNKNKIGASCRSSGPIADKFIIFASSSCQDVGNRLSDATIILFDVLHFVRFLNLFCVFQFEGLLQSFPCSHVFGDQFDGFDRIFLSNISSSAVVAL